MPEVVTLFEMGPRDGLQNEARAIPTADKIRLVDMLTDAGFSKVEAASFVSPKWVPQMADASEVMSKINRNDGVVYSALTPNLRGFEGAITAHMDEVAVFAAASEEFSQRNINCTIAESLERFEPVMKLASEKNIPVRGYVSCVVHCPYEGKVKAEQAARVTEALFDMGCYEVSLGDTIGKAQPEESAELLDVILRKHPASGLALHCHDTYGFALENIKVGLDKGIRIFDSSIAGLGGCPYAEGASGNVATEAVVSMLHSNGFGTGIDLEKLAEVTKFVSVNIKSTH